LDAGDEAGGLAGAWARNDEGRTERRFDGEALLGQESVRLDTHAQL
jgi:hypothetical protein